MDRVAFNEVWRHMHEGLTLASQSPAYEQFPVLAARVKRESKEFAAQPPSRSEDKTNLRRLTAKGMMAS